MNKQYHFPRAEYWMWNYCIPLGKFELGPNKYDLGMFVSAGKTSHAIVYGNVPGEYMSGEIMNFNVGVLNQENINRWITFQLDGL